MPPFKKNLIISMLIIGIVLAIVGFVKEKGLIQSEKDIENTQILTGQTDVEGKGITITVADSNPDDISMRGVVHDMDLITIVNILQYAGAEAISINNERIISTSKIKANVVKIKMNINNNEYNSPFIIKAIGNPKTLIDILNSEPTSAELHEFNYIKRDLAISINTKDKLIIPKYKGNIYFEYAKSMKK